MYKPHTRVLLTQFELKAKTLSNKIYVGTIILSFMPLKNIQT